MSTTTSESATTSTSATTSDPTSTDAALEELTALTRHWGERFNAGDLTALMATYEPDALIVPGPGADPVSGTGAVRAALEAFLGLGGQVRTVRVQWLVAGDLALGRNTHVMEGAHDPAGNPVHLAGTTAEVARRQADGSWKYVLDHPFGGAE